MFSWKKVAAAFGISAAMLTAGVAQASPVASAKVGSTPSRKVSTVRHTTAKHRSLSKTGKKHALVAHRRALHATHRKGATVAHHTKASTPTLSSKSSARPVSAVHLHG